MKNNFKKQPERKKIYITTSSTLTNPFYKKYKEMIEVKAMSDYVIVGDTKDYKDCLVCVCGTQDRANEVLDRMLNNPTDNDKKLMQGHHNLRVAEVPKEDCWWHGNCD